MSLPRRAFGGALLLAMLTCGFGCSANTNKDGPLDAGGKPIANVTTVTASGQPGAYTFSVSILSGDTGCDLYANWWEVLSADGNLIYRRILGHSHVEEQPFTRSGGPVDVTAEQALVIRAHLHHGDDERYGGSEFVGSVAGGFAASGERVAADADVENAAPQPTGCAF